LEQVNRTTIVAPVEADGNSTAPSAVSADGRYAVFVSKADNLVSGDTNHVADLFLYDAVTDALERVNLGAGGLQANAAVGHRAAVSDDGRWVFFESYATNLTDDVVSAGNPQIYLRDRATGTTMLLSRGSDGAPMPEQVYFSDASSDGRYVLFSTFARLSPSDTNLVMDLYRLDRTNGQYLLVSATPSGIAGDNQSSLGQLSADGRFAAFESWADNLVAGDGNGDVDLFWRDLQSGTTQMIGPPAPGGPLAGFYASELSAGNAISDDGRYVYFLSWQALELADTNGDGDGYRFDSADRSLLRVTLGADGAQIGQFKQLGGISADGNTVVFRSNALFPMPGDIFGDRAYWRDIASGVLTPVELQAGPDGRESWTTQCVISGNASTAYCSGMRHGMYYFDDTEFSNVYRAVPGGAARRISRPTETAAAHADGNSGRLHVAASADGRYVVFDSRASNLVVGDNNGVSDVFLRDRLLGTTERISLEPNGGERTCPSEYASITPDGRYVVYDSCAVPTSDVALAQVYRHDRQTGKTLLISADYKGTPGNGRSRRPQISDDGNIVLFLSQARNLGVVARVNGDYFLRDIAAGTTTIVSRNPSTGEGNGQVSCAHLSGNGRFVAFDDSSSDLVEGDTNAHADVFVFDRVLTTLERVSLAADGSQLDGYSSVSGVSADGRLVLFNTSARIPGSDASTTLLLRDRQSGVLEYLSHDNRGFPFYSYYGDSTLSADGRRVAFSSSPLYYDYYVTSDELRGLFVFDRKVQRLYRFTPANANDDVGMAQFSADGEHLVFSSQASNLVDTDGNGHFSDVFVLDALNDPIFANGFQVPAY